jgi:hypothetical protein
MYRTAAFVLILAVGSTSSVLGETLAGATARAARDTARRQLQSAPTATALSSFAHAVSERSRRSVKPGDNRWMLPSLAATMAGEPSSALEQEQPALATTGLRKRTKILILLGAAAGFAATAYAIDQRVEDNTPSTLGTRED